VPKIYLAKNNLN